MTEFVNFVSTVQKNIQTKLIIEEASSCLDRFTDRFNACDLKGMDRELYFPHVLLSGASRLDWVTPGQVPTNFFVDLKQTGWDHTHYESKRAVLVDEDKVHFIISYSRRNVFNEILSMHTNLWIVIRIDGNWKISLRSY